MELMNLKEILSQLNIFAVCRRYKLPIWQCPQLLFLVMGTAIGITSLIIYLFGTRYIVDPLIISLATLLLATLLLVVSFVIIRSLERIAEANRLKSEFINIVSHQLRSPLVNLKWSAELLLSGRLGELKEEQLEHFKILTENSEKMESLVSELLIVSRIEMNHLMLQKTQISLAELVKEIILKHQAYAAASNIEIELEVQDSLPQAIADPAQIKLVIEKLLDNAIRYTKEKGKIKITLEKKEQKLLFEIEDTGAGIPKEDQKRVFQKFFRSENILRHQTEGSGIGLYTVKAIIEKSGGKIWFTSKENKGSTFWFTLPIFKK